MSLVTPEPSRAGRRTEEPRGAGADGKLCGLLEALRTGASAGGGPLCQPVPRQSPSQGRRGCH